MPTNDNKNNLSNYSINLANANERISLGDGVDLGINSTVSLWVNFSTNNNGVILADDVNASSSGYFLLLNTTTGDTYVRIGPNFGVTPFNTSWNLNQWYNIIIVRQGDTIEFFKDNISLGTRSGYGTTVTTKFNCIGAKNAQTNPMYGQISQVVGFDYALSTNQIDYIYNKNNPMAITGAEPVAYWPLGDNSNPNTPGSFPNISVGADSVFQFDRSSVEYVKIDPTKLNFTDKMSFSGWVKFTSTAQDVYTVVANFDPNSGYKFQMSYYRDNNPNSSLVRVQINSANNNLQTYTVNGQLDVNKWYHLAFSFDGTTNADGFNIYIDNVKHSFTANNPGIYPNTVNGTRIGNYQNNNTWAMIGEISNVQFWDTNLLDSDIATLYNNGQPLLTGTQPQASNLKTWYKLNQSANYNEGQLSNWTITRVGNPNYGGSNDGCYSVNPGLRWHDNNFNTVSNDYFQWNSPAYKTTGSNIVLSSSGGETATPFFGNELILEYSIDSGPWTLWHQQTTGQVGSTPVPFTIPSTGNLTVNNNIRVRARGVDGGGSGSFLELYNIQISGGTFSYNENFNESQRYGFFGNNGGLQPPVKYVIDPSWQIPDNRSEYPQSFEFTKTPQQYIDLGKDDWFNEYNNEITFSVWVNKKDWSNTGFEGIISKYGSSGATVQYRIAYPSSAGKLQFYLQGSATSGSGYSARIQTITLTSAQQASEWLHIIWRHKASTNESEVIFNGDYTNAIALTSANPSNDIAGHPYAQPQATTKNMIGNVASGLQPFDGSISNYQRFNSYLDNAAVEALYNDGVPSTTAIASTNSQAWYKLNDNEKFDGTNWSVENQKYPAGFDSCLSFDGSNDEVECGSISQTNEGDISFSAWCNVTASGTYQSILSSTDTSSKAGINIIIRNNGLIKFERNQDTSNTRNNTGYTVGGFSFGSWQHLCGTFNSTSGELKAYINGALQATSSNTSASASTTNNLHIGILADSTNYPANGMISNIAIYNTTLDSTAVTALYNNGTPETSISSSPVSWWKLDNTTTGIQDSVGSNDGTNNGATKVNTFVSTEAVTSSGMTEQNLVNNNVSVLNGESVGMNSTNLVTSNISRTQPYSNYSFNFDGATNDYINCTDADIFSFGDSVNDSPFSMSAWIKTTVGTARGIISKWGTTGTSGHEWIFWVVGPNKIRVNLNDGTNTVYQTAQGNTSINTGEWVHALVTYDGRGGDGSTGTDTANKGIKIYVNGVEDTPYSYLNSGGYVAMHNTARIVQLGGYNNAGQFDGQISNAAIFDRVLNEDEILNIYNNGITQDLQTPSTFSNNIVAWWPMDERSSYFDGNDWVVRDLENGNDGNGANTNNVEDMVGNAPGSEASGSGANVNIADLKGDMESVKQNAYSINMADYADGVTNPANSGRSTEVPSV
tara:strand:- start:297 stop:4502 length:4206 start_codon:yes stop_codon:yes gene_type:complete